MNSLPVDFLAKSIEREMIVAYSERSRVKPHTRTLQYFRDCTLQSSQNCWTSKAGPALSAVSRLPPLVDEVKRITGLDSLIPVRCGYKYYGEGDYIGIHTDRSFCDITLTLTTMEDSEPMLWWPTMRNSTVQELKDAFGDYQEFPDGGVSYPLEAGIINVFDGHNIPHARPKHGKGRTMIATICYMSLSSSPI
ncbi:hypothetical protein [Nocardia gipuzkoensis]